MICQQWMGNILERFKQSQGVEWKEAMFLRDHNTTKQKQNKIAWRKYVEEGC